jgi:hypothetical protein
MTNTTITAPLTARTFLFEDGTDADTAEAVGHAIRDHGDARSALWSVRHLSSSALELVDRRVGAATNSLLDQNLGDMLLSGWRKYVALTESARRTLAAPGSEEIVELLTHRVRSTYLPHVDLYIDGVLIHSFQFELDIVFDLTGLAAAVTQGQLVMLHGGKCVITTILNLEGAQLAKRQGTVDLELLVPLRPPVPLIDRPSAALPGHSKRW